jgi:hypothetical protein
MKKERLREIIREEIANALRDMEPEDDTLQEKSVPEPYDKKKKKKMNPGQVKHRKKMGDAMMKNPKAVAGFKKKFGDDWKDYLWATASTKALKKGA